MRTLVLLCLALLACGPKSGGVNDRRADPLAWWLPPDAGAPALLTPRADVEAGRALGAPIADFDFRLVYGQTRAEGPIEAVNYYLDVDLPGQPLYEVIIAYRDLAARDAFVAERLGRPNHGDEWSVDSGQGWPVRAWTFQNKLVVAAFVPGTEWEGEP